MKILSLRKAPFMKTVVAILIGLIVCTNLTLTADMANRRAFAEPEPKNEQLAKKVDDRMIAATSRFAFKLYGQVVEQRSSKNV